MGFPLVGWRGQIGFLEGVNDNGGDGLPAPSED